MFKIKNAEKRCIRRRRGNNKLREKKPKETSEDGPVGASEKQGTAMKGDSETVDATVKSVDMDGEGPKDQVAAFESEIGTAVLEQLSAR